MTAARHELARLKFKHSGDVQQHCGVPSTFDHARYSLDDVKRLHELYQEDSGKHSLLHKLFEDVEYDGRPSVTTLQMLEDTSAHLRIGGPNKLPPWCCHLVVHRDRFISTAIGEPEGNNTWTVGYLSAIRCETAALPNHMAQVLAS